MHTGSAVSEKIEYRARHRRIVGGSRRKEGFLLAIGSTDGEL
jgi:hypothetical protein